MTEQYQGQTGWKRVAFVVLFWIVFYVAQLVVGAVALAQCVFVLLTNNPNQHLLQFGDSLSKYIHDILRFVTFNTDQRPFPFADYPKPDLIIPAN